MSEPDSREPDQIRQDAARKLRSVQVSDHFQAILGCLLSEEWTTPRLLEMVITPDGHMVGRCESQPGYSTFLKAAEDLLNNIQDVGWIAALDGDESGDLLGKVAEVEGGSEQDEPPQEAGCHLIWQKPVSERTEDEGYDLICIHPEPRHRASYWLLRN